MRFYNGTRTIYHVSWSLAVCLGLWLCVLVLGSVFVVDYILVLGDVLLVPGYILVLVLGYVLVLLEIRSSSIFLLLSLTPPVAD